MKVFSNAISDNLKAYYTFKSFDNIYDGIPLYQIDKNIGKLHFLRLTRYDNYLQEVSSITIK